ERSAASERRPGAIDVSRRSGPFRKIGGAGDPAISSGEMEISDRRPNRFFAGLGEQDPLLRRRRRKHLCGRFGNGPTDLETDYRRAGAVHSALANGIVYATSYDGKFYALDAKTGAVKWKFAAEGGRRFEAKGIHGLQPKNQTI